MNIEMPEKLRLMAGCLFLQLLISCNFVHFQEAFLKRSIRRTGLKARKVEFDSDHISYWEGGKGPTLLLIHGFGADATFCWSHQIPELSKYFHLIVPDLLWFGESKSSEADFNIEHQSRAIQALLEHLKVEKFDVAGISYGGLVAVTLLSEIPQKIDRMVLISSPGLAYTADDYQGLLKRFDVKSASELVLPTNSQELDRLMKIAYHKPPYIPFFAENDVINLLKDGPKGERTALLEQLVFDLERLKNKTKPDPKKTLIIWGSEDPLFPLEIGKRLKESLGDAAELKIIPDARHAPNVEFQSQFNKILLNFLLPPKESERRVLESLVKS